MDRPNDPPRREPPSGPAATSTVAPYDAELAAACDAARLAGAAIREAFGGRQAVRYKTGDDPLTVTDETADRIIHDRLRAVFPADPWLSEEGDGRSATTGRLWVVDPLDGTREFVDGIPEFAVSIALVVDGRPVVGVVYQPIVRLLVCAIAGRGVTADDLPVTTTRQHRLADAVVLASRSEVGRGDWRPLESAFHVEPTGSIAWKLALVACGRADATISLAPKHGWDVAAGVLLVEQAGGRVARLDGSPLSLAEPGELIDGLIASNAPLFDDLVVIVGNPPTTSVADRP